MKQAPFVSFTEVCPVSPSSKLKRVWRVDSIANKTMLGSIGWMAHSKLYCFTPLAGYGLVFSANDLWDIADFCARMSSKKGGDLRQKAG